MIEQALYFGLGVALAGLFALAFAPVLWSRALRLTRQRLEAQIPVSMRDILADRDHLRAQFAVEQRKLEQAMERVRADKGRDMGELGRRATEIVALTEAHDAARATIATLEGENAVSSRALVETTTQAGSLAIALHDTHAYFERQLGDVVALRKAHTDLEETLETRRATIAGLNTRVMGLEMTIEDASRARAALERQISAMKQALNLISDERNEIAARLEAVRHTEGETLASGNKPDAVPRQAARDIDHPSAGEDDAALRQAIHELGLAVAAMTRGAAQADPAKV